MSAAKSPKGSGKGAAGDARPVRDKLIDAALDLAETRRWQDITLSAIAAHAAVPLGEALLSVSNRTRLIAALGRRIDAAVLSSLEKDPLDGSVRDKLFDLLMRRFDSLDSRRPAIASIAAGVARDPLSMACLGAQFLTSMSLMLETAGISADGCKGALRAKGLGAIQLFALRAWLKDTDPGLAATMSALDKGLRRAESLAGRGGDTAQAAA